MVGDPAALTIVNLTVHERGLAQFLAKAWSDFPHSFQMPNSAGKAVKWIEWRLRTDKSATETWSCTNLEDAARQYAWDDISREDSDTLRTQLIKALNDKPARDSADVVEACNNIFCWGGVARKEDDRSREWINRNIGRLRLRLKQAIKLLKDRTNPSAFFGKGGFPMNSAMTKVYALGDHEQVLIIYDGRVGAALGMFTVDYCLDLKLKRIPDELNFRYHDTQVTRRKGSRNPSYGDYRFQPLSNNEKEHTENMWRSGRILAHAAQLAKCSPTEMERGLFMVGYDLTNHRH